MEKVLTKYSSSGHYTPGIISNGILYISGQTSTNPETNMRVEGGIKAETQMVLKKLNMLLESANVTKNDVIMCRVYVSDIKYWPDVNEVYSQFFGEHKPARVVVPTRELNRGCLVEIEAMAEVNN